MGITRRAFVGLTFGAGAATFIGPQHARARSGGARVRTRQEITVSSQGTFIRGQIASGCNGYSLADPKRTWPRRLGTASPRNKPCISLHQQRPNAAQREGVTMPGSAAVRLTVPSRAALAL